MYVDTEIRYGPDLNIRGEHCWLHVEKCGEEGFPTVDTNIIVNDDPEYYPYCYTLGKKVCIRDSVYMERYDKEFFQKETVRNDEVFIWDDASLEKFTKRMKASSMSEELASAGMPLDYPFAVQISREDIYGKFGKNPWHQITGKLFLLGSNEVTKEIKLGKIAIHTGCMFQYVSERPQEFCVMQLV